MSTLTCYRGEGDHLSPYAPPEVRVRCGFTTFSPLKLDITMNELWDEVISKKINPIKAKISTDGSISNINTKKINEFYTAMVSGGKPWVTAWTRHRSQMYSRTYSYMVKIPNAHYFSWGPHCTVGKRISCDTTVEFTKQNYIVTDNMNWRASNILAFGHKSTPGVEVTFVSDIPLRYVWYLKNSVWTKVDRIVKNFSDIPSQYRTIANKLDRRKPQIKGVNYTSAKPPRPTTPKRQTH